MSSTTLIALISTARAQSSTTSIAATLMARTATPSAPPVSMAWNDHSLLETTVESAIASSASSLDSAMQPAIASMSIEGMNMSDASVMPMSGMVTGSAMAGMNMTGVAGRGRGVDRVWWLGVVGSLGVGAGVAAGIL
ncbi:hypothetical protein EJ02DRAFT_455946 [Clathrospora elynae]|uniref:Uncharacterized protein n=1 Tax=Clathrospora elynae TaxID=706981 RepID=A0A6A5SLI2_9PLEO|nr:hypothetical protein EJ02DRAFT_455946 [Clathrospora elynae]